MIDAAPTPVPEAWLADNGITSALEDTVLRDLDGDGFEVWREYVLDTDPQDPTSFFHAEIDYLPAFDAIQIRFGPTSQQRLYTLESTSNLGAGDWEPVDGLEPRRRNGRQRRPLDTATDQQQPLLSVPRHAAPERLILSPWATNSMTPEVRKASHKSCLK